jgi:dihydrodipicolinate reductase
MNISIIGYGRMGHEVKKLADILNINVKSIIDPTDPEATHNRITNESMKDVDVAIDFSKPDAVLENVKAVAENKVNIVVGTTGWYDRLPIVTKIVEENKVGMVYGPNFSIGANIFFKIINYASTLISKFEDFDPYVFEMHHRMKADSPSGTAKEVANIILKNFTSKNKLQFDRLNRRIEKNELHVVSLRAGYHHGFHLVGFDSEYETIEISHSSKGRTSFAKGALIAAKWIIGKKGMYNFGQVLEDIIFNQF